MGRERLELRDVAQLTTAMQVRPPRRKRTLIVAVYRNLRAIVHNHSPMRSSSRRSQISRNPPESLMRPRSWNCRMVRLT